MSRRDTVLINESMIAVGSKNLVFEIRSIDGDTEAHGRFFIVRFDEDGKPQMFKRFHGPEKIYNNLNVELIVSHSNKKLIDKKLWSERSSWSYLDKKLKYLKERREGGQIDYAKNFHVRQDGSIIFFAAID